MSHSTIRVGDPTTKDATNGRANGSSNGRASGPFTDLHVATRRIAELTDLIENAGDAIIALDDVGNVTFWNRGAEALFGWSAAEVTGLELLSFLPHQMAQPELDALTTELRAGRPWRATLPARRRDGTPIEVEVSTDELAVGGGTPAYFVIARDVTATLEAGRQAAFLSKMLDATNDGMLVVDAGGKIRYWNAALERMLGWSATEVVGRSTLDFVVTSMSLHERRVVGRQIMENGSALYEMTVTKRDASTIDVEVIATAHADDDGSSYIVSVIRDVGERNRVHAELGRVVNARSVVATSLSRLRALETLEATASAICDEIRRSLSLDIAAVHAFSRRDETVTATTLGVAAPRSTPVHAGSELPPARATYLFERGQAGPWVEELPEHPTDPYLAAWREAGFDIGLYTPIRQGDEVLGLIVAGTGDASIERLAGLMPSLLEYAAIAAALLGPDLERQQARADIAGTVLRIIEQRAFTPVFQPVVALESGATIGFEALTRFSDGTPPNVRFADAAAVGLSRELERATLEAAFEAAGPLSASAWLAVNCSPSVIADGTTLQGLLEKWGWLTIVEVTEHEEIADYAAFRAAVGRLGPLARLSVDDAGAGFASLRHILELGPQFVKLDIGLVRNLDRDPARQALIAGMVHFAGEVGCSLIAEGIETEAERDALVRLGVTFGQGYLLARPAPAEALARPTRFAPDPRPAADRPSR